MKDLILDSPTRPESGRLVEQIEVLRTKLRLAQQLNRADIERLLNDVGRLRTSAMSFAGPAQSESLERLRGAPRGAPVNRATQAADIGFEGVLGESPGILDALELVRRAAPTPLPMLIDGESGTGKELFARVVHANSKRADEPFISVNCGAIPENLIESELFGHKKGAFTGADRDRKGYFEAANGGTIFLDEVGELPMQGQVKLLRVLQVGEVQRVGSDTPVKVDARIVAATNRNLEQMSQEGGFREDLFYRLSVIHATLPPLRERRDEIPLLCEYFLNEAARELEQPRIKLSQGLQTFLASYEYPGNVRQLKNLIYRLSCLADAEADLAHLPKGLHSVDTVEHLGLVASDSLPPGASLADVKRAASDAAERRYLEQGLRETSGRVVDLARKLEMNRSHVQSLLKKHGLKAMRFRQQARQLGSD